MEQLNITNGIRQYNKTIKNMTNLNKLYDDNLWIIKFDFLIMNMNYME